MFGSKGAAAIVAQAMLDGEVGFAVAILHNAVGVVLGTMRPVAVGMEKLVASQLPQIFAVGEPVWRDDAVSAAHVGQSLDAPVVMVTACGGDFTHKISIKFTPGDYYISYHVALIHNKPTVGLVWRNY